MSDVFFEKPNFTVIQHDFFHIKVLLVFLFILLIYFILSLYLSS